MDVLISHLQRLHCKQRPWPELVDPNAFSRPCSFSEAASRVQVNAAQFRINYGEVVGAVLVLSLLSHPASLVCLALLCFAWFSVYLFKRSFSVLGHSFSRNELMSLLAAATALVLLFTNITSLLMHALLLGLALVSLHAAAFTCPAVPRLGGDHDAHVSLV